VISTKNYKMMKEHAK